jgi:ATP-dependent DNA helicase RecQ
MTPDLLLITSPPASGKTYWIRRLSAEADAGQIIFISPLRALADECKLFLNPALLVMTPEEWNAKQVERKIVIFDEFHLFFYWGDTFREKMWECFYQLSLSAHLVVLLTATVSEEMKQSLSAFSCHFETVRWLDFGNRKLKLFPYRYTRAPGRRWLIEQIENEKINQGVRLVFCRYRDEVLDVERRLSHLGFSCISCVGGESKFMQNRLKLNPNPDFIIATTVLSHGVNLPLISKVFFLYETQNIDFWIQMVARGGRGANRYEVFALENPPIPLRWNRFRNLFHVVICSLKREIFPRTWSLLE